MGSAAAIFLGMFSVFSAVPVGAQLSGLDPAETREFLELLALESDVHR